jgi:hypothetical protein
MEEYLRAALPPQLSMNPPPPPWPIAADFAWCSSICFLKCGAEWFGSRHVIDQTRLHQRKKKMVWNFEVNEPEVIQLDLTTLAVLGNLAFKQGQR